MKRFLLTFSAIVFCTLITGSIAFGQIANWDFTGQSSPATSNASSSNPNLTSVPVLTRGATAASSTASNSFRTVGFQNNGIATTNTDYFQVTLAASTGNALSISTIDARLAGTASFAVSPGVTSQFSYSTDGVTFTLIGSPQVIVGTPQTLVQINTSGIAPLQNVPAGTTVTLRYYASGQTATGGWGFNSPSTGQNGLAIGGTVSAPLDITTPNTMPNGSIGIPYSTSFVSSGGVGPYTYAVTAGAVPTGLTLNTNGSWSGLPTTAGVYNFDVTVTDSNPFAFLERAFGGKLNPSAPNVANTKTESFQIRINAPTASSASIRGKIVGESGRGLSRALIAVLNTQSGIIYYGRTNQLGYFNVADLPAGDFYIMQVQRKGYSFPESTSFQLFDDLEGLVIRGTVNQ
jgi:hypothetical protein